MKGETSTLKDVAKLANVSTATVSRVLNGACNVSFIARSDVLTAIEQLQYRPNLHAAELGRRNGRFAKGNLSGQERGPATVQTRADSRKQNKSQSGSRITGQHPRGDEYSTIRRLVAKLNEEIEYLGEK